MKEQSGPTHQLIRLVKYWFKGVPLMEKIYGGSYMMEIICSAVCYDNEEETLFEKFRLVLEKIANISQAKIAFEMDKNNEFHLLSEYKAEQIYRTKRFKIERNRKMGFIIDASNPFNNLLTFEKETIEDLEDYADIMGRRLQSLEDEGRQYLNEEGPLLNINKLFKPEFIEVEDDFDEDAVPDYFSNEWEVTNYKYFNARVEIKPGSEDHFKENKDAKMICEIYKNTFQAMIWNRAEYNERCGKYVYINGVAKLKRKGIVKEVEEECARKMFPDWDYDDDDERDQCYYIAYISVPYYFGGRKLAFRCAMKWEK